MWMSSVVERTTKALITALACAAAGATAMAADRSVAPEPIAWSVAPAFEKDNDARLNLSGAACAPTTPKFVSCLIANDEKKYAQFFSLADNALTPGELIRLSDADDDPDAEGVAYADGYFYVTGSHGRSRYANKKKKSSFVVFRFPVDRRTGQPSFKISDDKVVGVESSDRLREALRNGRLIDDYYNEPLVDGGLNVEGIAVKRDRMHFGLRAPSLDGRAFIVSVSTGALFSRTKDLKAKVTALALGKDIGIRDLAPVDDGVLILAGPTLDQAVPYSVWLWNGSSEHAKQLATLDLAGIDPKGKPEIVLPLEQGASSIRVLVMFDGILNGGPRSFRLPR